MDSAGGSTDASECEGRRSASVWRLRTSVHRPIVAAIGLVLADVRACVGDWRAMKARVAGEIAELKGNPPPLPVAEIAEAIQFLEWLDADNFTFLGIRNYVFTAGEAALGLAFNIGCGVSASMNCCRRSASWWAVRWRQTTNRRAPEMSVIHWQRSILPASGSATGRRSGWPKD